MALPDITKLKTEAGCAAAGVSKGLSAAKGALDKKLAELTAGVDGIFAAGANLKKSIEGEIKGLRDAALGALGDLEKNVISLRDETALALTKWNDNRIANNIAEKKLADLKMVDDALAMVRAENRTRFEQGIGPRMSGNKDNPGPLEESLLVMRANQAFEIDPTDKKLDAIVSANLEFERVKKLFPALDVQKLVAKAEKPGFSLCKDVKEQTISDGNPTPKNIIDAPPAATKDAIMVIPALAPLPAVLPKWRKEYVQPYGMKQFYVPEGQTGKSAMGSKTMINADAAAENLAVEMKKDEKKTEKKTETAAGPVTKVTVTTVGKMASVEDLAERLFPGT